MLKPIRIQRKRTKGFSLPENTVCIDRSTKWGNPFKLYGGDSIYLNCHFRRKHLDPYVYLKFGTVQDVVDLYRCLFSEHHAIAQFLCHLWAPKTGMSYEDFDGFRPDLFWWVHQFKKLNLSELQGKNLACWCPLNQPCHADVLLELANPKKEEVGQ